MQRYRPKIDRWCKVKNKRLFAYLQDETFTVNGREFTVPAFYWFDGATVPRLLWWLYSPTGIAFEAASLHDFLCDTKGRGLYGEYNLTKLEVDELFYEHLLQDETPPLQAKTMYLGVRTWIGQKYWDKESFPYYLHHNIIHS
jgi:hypothetical protein